MATLYQRNLAPTGTVPAGQDFTKAIKYQPPTTSDSVTINCAKSETRDSYFYSDMGVASGVNFTGAITIPLRVTGGNSDVNLSVCFQRVSGDGASVWAQTPFTATQVGSAGTKTFSITLNNTTAGLGTWSAGDRLRIIVRAANANTMTSRSTTIAVGTTSDTVTVPWNQPAPAAPTLTATGMTDRVRLEGALDGTQATIRVFRDSVDISGAIAFTGTAYQYDDMGASANPATHTYRVEAAAPSGNGGATSTSASVTGGRTAVPAPAPPTGLTATAKSSSGVRLNWTASSGATSYIVERSGDGGQNWVAVAWPTTNTVLIEGQLPSTAYLYSVIASNSSGSSGNSSQAGATTFAKAALAADVTTEVADSSFTGTEGTAWPADWSTTNSGKFQIQGNAGAIFPEVNTPERGWPTGKTAENVEALARVRLPDSAWRTQAHYAALWLRGGGGIDTAWPGSNYRVEFDHGTAKLLKSVNNVGTMLGQTATNPWPTDSDKWTWIRLRVTGDTLSFKIWEDGATEPSAWAVSVTDTSITGAGMAGFMFAPTVSGMKLLVDDFELWNVPAPVTLNPPTSLTAAGDANSVNLSWTPPASGTAPTSYNVVRAAAQLLVGDAATFTNGIAKWSALDGRTTLAADAGRLRYTRGHTGTDYLYPDRVDGHRVIPGQTIHGTFDVQAGTLTGGMVQGLFQFYDATDTLISTTGYSGNTTVDATSKSWGTATTVVPANAVKAVMLVELNGGAIGGTVYLDNASLTVTAVTRSVGASDAFNRADSATSLGTADSGQAWSNHNGPFGLTASKAYAVAGGFASIDVGAQGSGYLSVAADITVDAGLPNLNLLSDTNGNNRLGIQVEPTFVRLFTLIGGVFTQHNQTSITNTTGAAYRFTIEVNAGNARVLRNNVVVIDWINLAQIATLRGQGTNTRVGIGCDAASPARWDNLAFTVTTFEDTAVDPGITYSYTVRSVANAAESADSNTATGSLAPPSSPTSLTATGDADSINLEWTGVAGATEYRVRRNGHNLYTGNDATFTSGRGGWLTGTATGGELAVSVGATSSALDIVGPRVAVSPSQSHNMRIDIRRTAGADRNVRLWVQWFDASNTLLGDSFGDLVTTATTKKTLTLTTTSHASATQARIFVRMDVVAGDAFALDDAAIQPGRTQIATVTSPTNILSGDAATFTSGLGSWTPASSQTSLTHDATEKAALVTALAATSSGPWTSQQTVTPGAPYVGKVRVKWVTGTVKTLRVGIRWRTADGTFITDTSSASVTPTTTGYTELTITATAPETAGRAQLRTVFDSAATNDAFLQDDALLGRSDVVSTTYDDTGTVASDTFTRADNSTSLGTADSGQAWTVNKGTWGVSSNQAYCATAADHDLALVTVGTTDMNVKAKLSAGVSGHYWTLAGRANGNTYYAAEVNVGNGQISLFKVVGGAQTALSNAASGPGQVAVGNEVELRCSGSTISGWVNGVQIVSTTDTSITSGSSAGIRYGGSGAGLRWDDFSAASSLVNGTTYSYTVRAANAVGESTDSNIASSQLLASSAFTGSSSLTGSGQLGVAYTLNSAGTAVLSGAGQLSAAGSIPSLNTFRDLFPGTALDTSKWSTLFGESVSVANGTLSLNRRTDTQYVGVLSPTYHKFVNAAAVVEVVSVLSGSSGEVFFELDAPGDGSYYAIYVSNGQLGFRRTVSNVNSDAQTPYDAINHKWWRIRHDGTDVLFETSPTGRDGSWTIHRVVTPLGTEVRQSFYAGAWDINALSPVGTSFSVRNFNYLPGAATRSQVVSRQTNASFSSTLAVDLPAYVPGARWIMGILCRPTDGPTTPAGWTLLGDTTASTTGVGSRVRYFGRDPDGTEGGTLDVAFGATQSATAVVLDVSGSDLSVSMATLLTNGAEVEYSSGTTMTTTAPLPTFDPSPGLLIGFAALNNTVSTDAWDIPAGYNSHYRTRWPVTKDGTTYLHGLAVSRFTNGNAFTETLNFPGTAGRAAAVIFHLPAAPTTYEYVVLADEPVAYWRLEEISGTSVADSSANGRTGTATGPNLNVSTASAALGSAASFDGNDYISTPRVVTGLPFTVEGWVQTTGNGYLYGESDQTQNVQYWGVGVSGGVAYAIFRPNTSVPDVFGTKVINDGVPHHLVFTFSYVSDTQTAVSMYVDGVLEATGTTMQFPSATSRGGIGYNPRLTATGYFTGMLDEVAVYNKVLATDRITAHYNAGKPTGTPSNFAGSSSLTGSGQLGVAYTVGARATAPLTGSGQLVAAPRPSIPGASPLTGSGQLVAAPRPSTTATAPLTGSGQLGVALTNVGARATAPLTGSGQLTAAGRAAVVATAPLSGSGQLGAAPVVGVVAAAALTGSGSLLAAPTTAAAGSAVLSGSGALVAVGAFTASGTVLLTGSGALVTTGSSELASSASAVLAGSGQLVAGTAIAIPGSAVLSGSGALAASSSVATAAVALLTGAGALVVAGQAAAAGAAALTGAGALSASGAPASSALVGLTGAGALVAGASPSVAAVALLAGSGQLGSLSSLATSGAAVLAGSGALTTTGTSLLDSSAAAALTGSGQLSTGIFVVLPGIANLTGAGALSLGTVAGALATVVLSGAGSLVLVGGPLTTSGIATLAGSGALAASGTPAAQAAAQLAGSGELLVGTRPALVGAANLSGEGQLAGSALPTAIAVAALMGAGQLQVVGGPTDMFMGLLFEGSGQLGIVGDELAASGTAVLAGSGQLALSGIASNQASVGFSGEGELTVAARVAVAMLANLGGDGTLAGAGAAMVTAIVQLAGSGALGLFGQRVIDANLEYGELQANNWVAAAIVLGMTFGMPEARYTVGSLTDRS